MAATASQTYCVGGLRLALNLPDGPVVEKGGVAEVIREGNNPPATSAACTN